jgi:drug/metabolite transporter (DMT)-like permease
VRAKSPNWRKPGGDLPGLVRAPLSPGALYAVIAGICWGVLAPSSKWLFRGGGGASFDGYLLAVARSVWAAPCLLSIAAAMWPRGRGIGRAGALRFVAAALLVGFGLNLLFQVGTQLTSAAHAVLFVGLIPIALAAVEALFFKRALAPPQRAGLAFGALGAVLVTLGRSGHGASPAGDAVLLVWISCFAAYTLIARKLMETYPPLFVAALSWGGGFAIIAVVGAPSLPAAIAHTFVSPQAAAVLLIGIVAASGIVAPALHVKAVQTGGIALATAGSQYASIATGLALSFGVLGESLTPFGIAGALLMLAGLVLTLLPVPNGTPRVSVAAVRRDVPEIRG